MIARMFFLFALFFSWAASPSTAFAQRAGEPCSERQRSGYAGGNATFCEARTFSLAAAPARLDVDAGPNGSIEVRGDEGRSVVQVRAVVQAYADTEAQARADVRAVRIGAEGGRLRADGPPEDAPGWWQVSYALETPSAVDLVLRTRNGDLSVQNVSGRARLTTQNGGLDLDGLGGDVRARTTNGGLAVRLRGRRWVGAGLDAATTNGDVELLVPEGYAARLVARTNYGSVNVALPSEASMQASTGNRLRLDRQIGGGGPTVRTATTNGSVTIRRPE